MVDDFPERFVDGDEETQIGNNLDKGVVEAFRSGVANSDNSQKTILTAAIAPHIEVVDEEEEIFKIDESELNLEKWGARYD